jgi:transcriptional regulator with XRE-family HTH domain
MPTIENDRAVTPDGAKLKAKRRSLGWTVVHLAEKAGCSKRSVTNAQAGRPVLMSTLTAIALALGANFGDMLAAQTAEVPKAGMFRLQVVLQANMEVFARDPARKMFLQLLRMLVPDPEDIQIINVTEGSVIITLETSERNMLRLVALWPSFNEHAFNAVRDLPEGLEYIRGNDIDEESAARIKWILDLAESVRELRIQINPDAAPDIDKEDQAPDAPSSDSHQGNEVGAILPGTNSEKPPYIYIDGVAHYLELIAEAEAMPPSEERDYRLRLIHASWDFYHDFS